MTFTEMALGIFSDGSQDVMDTAAAAAITMNKTFFISNLFSRFIFSVVVFLLNRYLQFETEEYRDVFGDVLVSAGSLGLVERMAVEQVVHIE